MTYNVFIGTLNPAQSVSIPAYFHRLLCGADTGASSPCVHDNCRMTWTTTQVFGVWLILTLSR